MLPALPVTGPIQALAPRFGSHTLAPRFAAGASEDRFEMQTARTDIPDSWPEPLKAIFRAPKNDLQLDDFRVKVSDYAQPVTPLRKRLGGKLRTVKGALFKTRAGGIDFDWSFFHRIGQKTVNGKQVPDPDAPSGAVHALTIVKDRDGKEYVHLVVERKPPFGGEQPIIQLPAGVMDKPDVSLLDLGMAEVHEETPFKPVDARVISSGPMPTSPGATTEQKGFVAVRAVYDAEKASKDYREGAELYITDTGMNVPLDVFADATRFKAWTAEKEAEGFKVAIDVPAVRGLVF